MKNRNSAQRRRIHAFAPVETHADPVDGERIVIVDGDTVALAPAPIHRPGPTLGGLQNRVSVRARRPGFARTEGR
ncbi:hypothetical protein [Mesorhizobium sp.]|uniref:hypothetical protein n=1 Tax=Mesorhizobium sp. TaxID=1871066 RepID=UPI000FE63FFD|nr:hypothetical protein [Mesorhizobium sp.]RWO55384.1 MAG: hypothetical protein EOS14_30065 [Mesorhizobium sp.]